MNFLEDIIKEKQEYLDRRKKELPLENLIKEFEGPKSESQFKNILRVPGLHIIAEIKRASPSKGDLRPNLDPVEVAKTYKESGIELVSVLTEEGFFKGSMRDLKEVHSATGLSLLCKDFIIDGYQIYEAKKSGADAILLIVAILSQEKLRELIRIAKELKTDVIVEIHNEEELSQVLDLGSSVDIIGINHRNLVDFTVDLGISDKLFPRIPEDRLVISESGICSAGDVRRFRKLGVNGILIGESLMKDDNMVSKLKDFASGIA